MSALFGGVRKAGAAKVELKVDEVGPMGAGDTAYERSHYNFIKADGSIMDHGKYVHTYTYTYGISLRVFGSGCGQMLHLKKYIRFSMKKILICILIFTKKKVF